jgi:uncharacterized membrane protein
MSARRAYWLGVWHRVFVARMAFFFLGGWVMVAIALGLFLPITLVFWLVFVGWIASVLLYWFVPPDNPTIRARQQLYRERKETYERRFANGDADRRQVIRREAARRDDEF